jgi:hypothetical protein
MRCAAGQPSLVAGIFFSNSIGQRIEVEVYAAATPAAIAAAPAICVFGRSRRGGGPAMTAGMTRRFFPCPK